MKRGILYGVGVGPGDPELITRKAQRIIAQAQAEATAEAARILAEARREIERERRDVRAELQRQAVRLAHDISNKALGAELENPAAQAQFIDRITHE